MSDTRSPVVPGGSSSSGNKGHLSQFNHLPRYDRALTAGDPAVVPIAEAEQFKISALGLEQRDFHIVSLAEVVHSPLWYRTVQRCKEAGYRFLGFYTAELPILEMLRITESKDGVREAAAAAEGSRYLAEVIESSNGLDWFQKIVSICNDLKASDIHFEVRESSTSVRIRRDGVMRDVMSVPSSLASEGLASAFTLLAEERSRSEGAFNALMPQAAMIPLKLGELQVNLRYQSHPVVGGLDATLRILRINAAAAEQALRMDSLGYLAQQVQALTLASQSATGGVFLAGMTGSGKTTTLNTLLNGMARDGLRKIITIEDPVEYIVNGVSHYSVQRATAGPKSGDSNPFLGAMMAFLRMDPDVGLFGEIRDAQSAQMAQAAIQTGHKILTTVHANSALSIIGRLCSSSIGLTRDNLCSPGFISALAYQALLPVNCPHCKRRACDVRPLEDLAPYREVFGLDLQSIYAASDEGCEHCRAPGIDYRNSAKIGVKGVKVVAEVILPDEQMLEFLLKGADFEALNHWRKQRRTGFDDPDMSGKEVWGHALYDMSQGLIDPFYFEHTFGAPLLFQKAVAASDFSGRKPQAASTWSVQ